MARTVFNNAQMHVLDMMSHIKTDEGLNVLKNQLAKYYAALVDDEMDKLWESGQWNEETLKGLQTAHFRTEYK